jgi:hypothetical protein
VSREAEFLEDRLHVPLDGARAEEELLPDGAVRAAFGEEREHVPFAVGQVVEHRPPVSADERLHDLRIERGAAEGYVRASYEERSRRRVVGFPPTWR